ncbi:hypothetical protein FKM82_003510 [Ascaphus truei]
MDNFPFMYFVLQHRINVLFIFPSLASTDFLPGAADPPILHFLACYIVIGVTHTGVTDFSTALDYRMLKLARRETVISSEQSQLHTGHT